MRTSKLARVLNSWFKQGGNEFSVDEDTSTTVFVSTMFTNALMPEPAASATILHPRSYLYWDFTNRTTTNRYYVDEEKVAFSEETENAL